MENYNLTAELKKIASGITSTDPNTELGNINSGVGNLDTAMQGVATAINGISIPNPGSNIDGVATAINNKNIPDPNTNIAAVANAIVSMAGGKDLDDLIAILTTMNGNIANLGSNHITNIVENPSGYLMYKGDGTITPLPNKALYTTYTDTNNIGATNAQGAIDKISQYTTGKGTLNTTYVTSGTLKYQKFGKVVTVFVSDIRLTPTPLASYKTDIFATGLPKPRSNESIFILTPLGATVTNTVRLLLDSSGTIYYHFSGISVASGQYYATFTYICD